MIPHTIAFIGAGSMARSLIGGLVTDGYDPARLVAADTSAEARASLQRDFGVAVHESNPDAVRDADIVILAVKPQVVAEVARALAGELKDGKRLVISIAAGIRLADLEGWLGGRVPLVRAMPNTPALVQSGATALCANAHAGKERREAAEMIMRAVGLTLWLDDEAQMDAVTALSGSGPAYFFLVMEAIEAAGRRLGLPAGTARLLTIQTAFGAAKMALEITDSGPADLRMRVTSPGGTTERAIATLRDGGLEPLFERALAAARDRSIELSKHLGKK